MAKRTFAYCERCERKRWGKKEVHGVTEVVESSDFDCHACGHVTNNIVVLKKKFRQAIYLLN